MPSSNCTASLDASTAAEPHPVSCTGAPKAHSAPQAADWPAVVSMALGVFGLVTAEFLPASLLTGIAASLEVSDGTAGQAVTATAMVAAIAAPSMPLLTRKLDRRLVMIALTVLLLASNVLSVLATSLPTLLLARVMLGVALGGFWAMSAALTMRLVPASLFARAMSIILTGVSVATVCAAPIGAWMGEVWGWRSAFVAAGVVSVITLLAQIFTLPALPPLDKPNLRTLGQLLLRRKVQVVLLAVVLVIAGHFAGFTYIRPLMEQVTQLSAAGISAVLLGYGIGGFLGNFAGGWLAGRSERLAIVCGSSLVALLAVALLLGASAVGVTAVAITLWGFAFGAFPVGFQTWMVRTAPDQAEGAGGLMVAGFQIAIATGAVVGGLMVDHWGALGAPAFSLVAMTLGALLVLGHGPKSTKG
ncbi:MAG: MFS transporter [Acidovorax sp.]|nr:MFS transporter [Acidovorax sp.]